MKNSDFLCCLTIGFTGLATLAACAPKAGPPEGDNFLCYADAALTEEHVGVKAVTYKGDGFWILWYEESPKWHIYRQKAGETCSVDWGNNP